MTVIRQCVYVGRFDGRSGELEFYNFISCMIPAVLVVTIRSINRRQITIM